MSGYNRDILKEYVPALVYTMYDGYYIYSPYTNTLEEEDEGETYKNGQKLSGLKPYIFYSCRYKRTNGDDFVITYTLDNYITIQGIVNGEQVFDEGYLINDCSGNGEDKAEYRGIDIGTENLTECIVETKEDGTIQKNNYTYTKVNGVKYYKDGDTWFSLLNGERYTQNKFKEQNNSAVKYYSEATEFRNRILNTYNLGELTTAEAVFEDGSKTDENGQTLSQKLGWRKLQNI